jgi:sugar/nucleoside kinase (ribokinase family)
VELKRVTVIGDTTLDVTVRPAQAPRAGGDVPARITLAPGGQGANLAVRLARAGVAVRLATALGDDAAGRLLAAAMEADGVAVVRLSSERTAAVVALLDEDGERTMLSDRVTLEPERLAAACEGVEWVHCSLYALADDASGDALAGLLRGLPAAIRVSAGGGSLPPDPSLADRVRDRIARSRVGLLLMSREEASSLLDAAMPSQAAAADAVAGAFPGVIAIVTSGAGGSAAAGPGFALSVPAPDPAGPVVDATGAGDAYAAAVIAQLLDTSWPPASDALRAAMEAGSRAGALVSRVLGAQGRISGEPEDGA